MVKEKKIIDDMSNELYFHKKKEFNWDTEQEELARKEINKLHKLIGDKVDVNTEMIKLNDKLLILLEKRDKLTDEIGKIWTRN